MSPAGSRYFALLLRALQEFRAEHGCPKPADILDVGCSAGIGTRRLSDAFPAARVTGLDASPHFLAVAEFRERDSARCAHLQVGAAGTQHTVSAARCTNSTFHMSC